MTAEPPDRPAAPRPDSPDIVTVTYSPTFTSSLLIAGVVCLVGGAIILRIGAAYVGLLLLGVLLVALWAAYRRRTYFTFEPASHTITIWAPAGPNHRPFRLSPGTHLSISGNRFVANLADGRRIKIPVYRFMADRNGWDAVVGHVPDLG